MLLPFSVRVAECPSVWERAVHSVICTCFVGVGQILCVCPSFPFGIEGGMWGVIVLIPDHCLSIYFEHSGKVHEDYSKTVPSGVYTLFF